MGRTFTSILLIFVFFGSIAQRNGIIDAGTTRKSNTGLSVSYTGKELVVNIDNDNLKEKALGKDSLVNKLAQKANLANTIFTGTVSLPPNTSIGNVGPTEIGYIVGITDNIQNQLNTKANTNNPTFTGTVSGITKSMVGLGNVDNLTSATLLARANHTGTQPTSTITGLGSVALLNSISLTSNV